MLKQNVISQISFIEQLNTIPGDVLLVLGPNWKKISYVPLLKKILENLPKHLWWMKNEKWWLNLMYWTISGYWWKNFVNGGLQMEVHG